MEEGSTIKEFYEGIGDYGDVCERFGHEKLIQKCIHIFADDPNYTELEEGLAKGDIEKAFRAVHTLKGVALNLAFIPLYETASEMTEKLRAKDLTGAKELEPKLTERYQKIISRIPMP